MVLELTRRSWLLDFFELISYFANVLYSKIFGNAVKAETNEEAGDEAASVVSRRASALMDKYGNTILRIAYSYLHNMSDAEDILQDTLIQFLKNNPTFETDGHEKAWLVTVASNLSKNRINYNKLRSADELSEELVSQEKEDLNFVWEAVKELPENNREVIHLFYQEGYSTKEIADILKRKESTVRSDLKRGRERLQKILKEAYDFE